MKMSVFRVLTISLGNRTTVNVTSFKVFQDYVKEKDKRNANTHIHSHDVQDKNLALDHLQQDSANYSL